MSLLIFLAVLGVLVLVHEWGHFITARLLGVKVEKFSIGFGPQLFSRTWRGTDFLVSLIPLGGYVKMSGDERGACTGDPGEFYAHPIWHRSLIVLMGPIINFVFAYICFYVIFVSGFPMLAPQVGKVLEGYPAQVAGFQEGDRILDIDGVPIESWDMMQERVAGSDGGALRFTLMRSDQKVAVSVTPQAKVLKNIFGQEETVRLVGIQPAEAMVFLKTGWVDAFGASFDQLGRITTLTYRALFHVITGGMPARDALAGPIRIFDVIKNAAEVGLSSLIYIMAVISASLAIFNLFPIPVLDGGHLMMFAIEKVRGRPLPPSVEESAMKAGLGLLLCLMVFVLYNDMSELGWFQHLTQLMGRGHQ